MDRKLLLLINQQWTNALLDRVMAVLSSFDLWAPILLVGALLLLWRGGFVVRSLLVMAALAAGVCDGLVCNPLKQLIGRARPHQALPEIRMVDLAKAHPRLLALSKPVVVKFSAPQAPSEGRSFPSSHTANTMTVAVIVGLCCRRWAWLGLVVPFAVGYSRIYTGSHWPSDIAGSLALGAVLGLLCAWGAAVAWRRWAPCWFPQLTSSHPSLFPA